MTNTPSTQPTRQNPMHPTLDDAGNVRGVGRAQEALFWLAPDGDDEPTVWTGARSHPVALLRRCDVSGDDFTRDELLRRVTDEERAAVVAELEQARAEVQRLRGPFRCCPHCVDDPEYHAENPKHSHDVDCTACGRESDRRAEAAEAREVALRERIEALAGDHEAWMNANVPAKDLDERDEHRGFVHDLRAALAAEPTPPAAHTCPDDCEGLPAVEWRLLQHSFGSGLPTPPAAPHAEDGALFVSRSSDGTRWAHDRSTKDHTFGADCPCRPAPVADPSGTGETR